MYIIHMQAEFGGVVAVLFFVSLSKVWISGAFSNEVFDFLNWRSACVTT